MKNTENLRNEVHSSNVDKYNKSFDLDVLKTAMEMLRQHNLKLVEDKVSLDNKAYDEEDLVDAFRNEIKELKKAKLELEDELYSLRNELKNSERYRKRFEKLYKEQKRD